MGMMQTVPEGEQNGPNSALREAWRLRAIGKSKRDQNTSRNFLNYCFGQSAELISWFNQSRFSYCSDVLGLDCRCFRKPRFTRRKLEL